MTSLAAVQATQEQHETRLSAVEARLNWILSFSIVTLVGIVLVLLKLR